MKLYLLLLVVLMGTTQISRAQVILQTELFKTDGTHVNDPDSADFVRIVEKADSGSTMLIIREFYADGTRKSLANSVSLIPLQYEGSYISFHPNGKKKEMSKYHNGYLIDTTYNFYPNGRLYTAKYEIPPINADKFDAFPDPTYYIKTMKDSTGKDIVIEGNGQGVIYEDDFKMIVERGEIKNGVHEGIWIGELQSPKLKYLESFSAGKLISGESTETDGTIYRYTQDRVNPHYKGGMELFYKYIRENVRYPPSAQENHIQGKVYMKFTILEDGTLTDIRMLHSPGRSLTEEAFRVIRNSGPWEPATWKGKKVKVAYNMPVSFTLSGGYGN